MNLNKQTVIYIFIFIFIIITFIHLYKINNNNKENFIDLNESQNLQGYDVFINSMSQVKFINENNNRESLQTIIDNKASKTELNNKINDAISDKVTKKELNDAMPELSVISYAGSKPPTGWQLCNGEILQFTNGINVYPAYDNNKFSSLPKKRDTNGIEMSATPDLRGRFILGNGGTGNNKALHEMGGEENVTLTIAQMPNHEHKILANQDGSSSGNLINNTSLYIMKANDHGDTARYKLAGTSTVASMGRSSAIGSSESHNNMPPYYVLIYIIKQPFYSLSPPSTSS